MSESSSSAAVDERPDQPGRRQVLRRRDNRDHVALCIKAFTACRASEPISQLRFTAREPMPRLSESPVWAVGSTKTTLIELDLLEVGIARSARRDLCGGRTGRSLPR